MNPKQVLFDVLNHKKVETIPWVPFAGVHAGKLVGYDATEVLQDPDKLLHSLLEVNKLYKPNGQPVVFDLQLESEILGCELVWAKDGPPSVKTHPLEEVDSVPCKCQMPTAEDGRMPIVLKVMREMKEKVGDTTALYGLICGPFTLASHLRGTEIFLDMYDDEDYVADLLDYCLEVAKTMSDLFIEAGMDVIAVVDPLVSQISADHFSEFLDAPFSALFEHIRAKGAYSSFFVCGDATRNIDVMCQTKPDSISVDENVDLIAAKAITDKHNITIGGNIPLTSVMLHGTQEDNMKYVIDLIDKIEATTNLIILRTSFASIPESLIEAAEIDGAGHLKVFTQIVLPLSKASLAVIALYYGVAHWNSWLQATIYLRDRDLYPLQVFLREILIANQLDEVMMGSEIGTSTSVQETVKYATIMVSIIPVLMIYPWVQRFFVKGVMIGAVKS